MKKIIITENQFNRLIEVKYISAPINNPINFEKGILKDNEVIRVYHGFDSIDDAIIVAKQGLSGKSLATQHKIYSYETGNNPYGLFVSVDFNVVKRNFSHGGVIMEFSTKVSDLEAPVWKGQESYFTQGSYTKSFSDKEERETQRLKYRDQAVKDYQDDKYLSNIAKSDRPELAQSLFDSPEKQAIFTGDLNPNMIKRFWIHENMIQNRITTGNYIPLTREEFIKRYGSKEIQQYKKEKHENKDLKLFYPNDNLNLSSINPMDKDILSDDYKLELDRYLKQLNEVINSIKTGKFGYKEKRIITLLLWPKQIMQAIGTDNFNKYFNEYL